MSQSVIVLDPHGGMVEDIKDRVPKKKKDDVVVLDFGIKNFTPQITIRGNVDITNPSLVSDGMSEAMRESVSSQEKYWGPKLAYYFACLYFIYSVCTDLTLADIRLLVSRSPKAKVLITKIKAIIQHPIIKYFLDELPFIPYESIMPVVTRLSHLLLDEKSFRLFTQEENKISIKDIMDNGKLLLVNLAIGIIGRQRCSILSGLLDSLINNNAIARAAIPYEERNPVLVIKDEFYLGPGDLDSQLTGLAKFGISVIFAHQYLSQVEGRTREVLATAGSRIIFKTRRVDAEIMGQDFGIHPEEFTSLKKFQAIANIDGEIVKINTPKPVFNKKNFSKEIMDNCIKKYYLKNDKDQEQPILEFDRI